MGREDDGAQCNGDFVTHLSSTVCTVNPSIQDPSGRGIGGALNDAPITIRPFVT